VISCKGEAIELNSAWPEEGRIRSLGYVGSFLLQYEGVKALSSCNAETESLVRQILKPIRLGGETQVVPSYHPTERRTIDASCYPISPSQCEAVLGLQPGLEIIHGPPGTGKSTTIWHIINSCCLKESKCLITCTRNQAVNSVVEKVASLGVLVFGNEERLGEEAKKYTLRGRLKSDVELLFWEKIDSAVSNCNTLVSNFVGSIYGVLWTIIPVFSRFERKMAYEKIDRFYDADSDSEDDFNPEIFVPGRHRSAVCLWHMALKKIMVQNVAQRLKLDCNVNGWTKLLQRCTSKLAQILKSSKKIRRKNILKTTRIYLATIDATPRMASDLNEEKIQLCIDTCIVDEAGCVLECAIPMLLQFGPSNLILIGDHKQLQPFTTIQDQTLLGSNHTRSLLERGVQNGFNPWFLSTQFRMHPTICTLVSRLFYGNKLKTFAELNRASVYKPCAWIDVHSSEISHNGKGYSNPKEAREVCGLAKKLLDICNSVWIITFYNKQRSLILDIVRKDSVLSKSQIPVLSIDSCQGSEADYVILSPVRTEHVGEFMEDPRRICVALSRARYGCYIVGDKSRIEMNGKGLWKNIAKHYQTDSP